MSNDIQHFQSFDCLARSLRDLQTKIKDLTGKGVTVIFQKEDLSFEGNVIESPELNMLNACSDFERSLAGERIREGIATAKANGKRIGRPKRLNFTPEQIAIIKKRFSTEDKTKLAKELGISRPTLYKITKN